MPSTTIKTNLPGHLFQSNRWHLIQSTLAINVLSLALPVLTLQIYDRIIPAHGATSLTVLILGVVSAIVVEACLKMARAYLIGWNGAAFEHRAMCHLVGHYLHANLYHLEKHGSGAHLQQLAAVSTLKSLHNGETTVTVIESVFVLVFLGLIAYVGGGLVLVPLAILALFAALNVYHGLGLKAWLGGRAAADTHRYNFLIQSLQGVGTVKALGLEKAFQRRYEFMQKQSTLANYAVAHIHGNIFNNANVVSQLMVTTVVTVGALQVLSGRMSVGVLVACILLSGRIMQPVQKMLQLWVRNQDFAIASSQIQTILQTPSMPVQAPLPLPAQQGSCQLQGVFFRYPRQQAWQLENINLALTAGQTVAINGRNGSGRSTLVKLMAGVYHPQQGEVLLEKTPTTHIPAEQLSSYVSLVSPAATLFRGTIRENLTRFGRVEEAQAMETAALLAIPADVAKLPAGLDTPLEGTQADTIPPGLRRRIAIAAALAARPRIILFDNADHGLDRHGHALLLKLIKTLQPSAALILISQDPALLSLATRHYTMYRGRLLPSKPAAARKKAVHRRTQKQPQGAPHGYPGAA